MADREWDLPENQATDRSAFRKRRKLLAAGAVLSLTGAAGYAFYRFRGTDEQILAAGRSELPTDDQPEPRIEKVIDYSLGRAVTEQANVARYVNFYELSPTKFGTWRKADAIPVDPWTITIDGLVQNPMTMDIDELLRTFDLEQRVYRHRCVEAWAMVVPWMGIPFRKIIDKVQPLDKATYVRFVSADIQRLVGREHDSRYRWPYQEGLTIAEANNELTFLATGYYGERLFKQNGAPIRLIVPWKYGFKSAKSLVHIEFTDKKPWTFWNAAAPDEYGFYANVNPAVDHPRWSQKQEWMIDTREVHPTERYNGYGKWVADLYTGNEV